MNIYQELTKLGYTYQVNSFGVDVFKNGRLVFHGFTSELIEWLQEKGEM